jgi:TatD DNase family protein
VQPSTIPSALDFAIVFDTHAHLDDERFSDDLDAVLRRAREAGVEGVVAVGVSAGSSRVAVELAGRHDLVYAAVGIQPNEAAEAGENDWDRIVALLDRPRVVAIGETGLDRHWDFTPFDVQREYFDRHLRLSQERGLPVVIHCREAEADLLPMLREAAVRAPIRGVIHSFSGDPAFAHECLSLGLFISFAGQVTYTNKKFEGLKDVARSIPDDRIVVETDSPYLVPHPLRGREKRNEPARVALTTKCLAELRGLAPEALAAQTTANARRLFLS